MYRFLVSHQCDRLCDHLQGVFLRRVVELVDFFLNFVVAGRYLCVIKRPVINPYQINGAINFEIFIAVFVRADGEGTRGYFGVIDGPFHAFGFVEMLSTTPSTYSFIVLPL